MTKLCDELELLIDKYGVASVLGRFSDVCREKAEHVRANWQDEALANEWYKLASKLAHLHSVTRSI
jgi:hypothetical protein